MKIHPTSIIHDNSKIDDSVEIGPFCIIDEDVEIKKGTKLLSHVVLRGPTTIGEDNIFYQFSTIGEDTPDKKFKGEKTKLQIGDRNIFRETICDIKYGAIYMEVIEGHFDKSQRTYLQNL